MDFRILKYFVSVVSEGNISKAAKKLHVSQPTLSKQLKDLEDSLGVTLFIRGNREIELTEEGNYLYSRAKEILALVDETTAQLSEEETLAGDVYIGGGETRGMSIIAKAKKKMLESYPNIKVHLYSGDADDVTAKLDSNQLDFALVVDPSNRRKYHSLRLMHFDRWGVLIHKNHCLAIQSTVQPEDLTNVPLFLSKQSLEGNQIPEWFGNDLSVYHVVGTYNLLYNASIMVEQGIGAAIGFDGIINTADTNIAFVPLEPPLTEGMNIIWNKNQQLTRTAAKFLEVLKDVLEMA